MSSHPQPSSQVRIVSMKESGSLNLTETITENRFLELSPSAMEPMEGVSEGEWSSLSGIYTTEEADFMAQLLRNAPPDTNPGSGAGSGCWPSHDSTGVGLMGSGNSSFYHSNSSSSPGVIFFSPSGNGDDYLNLNDTTNPVLESGNGSVLIDSDFMRECDLLNPEMAGANVGQLEGEEEEANEKENDSLEISRKRSRSTGNFRKAKMNVKLKKSRSLEFSSRNDEYANASNDKKMNAQVYKPSSRSCGSGDDSSISQGQNGRSVLSMQGAPALNRSWKTRASRGSATDPQSLYARKRRERINERLKILQSLIPNGTKVDISTMLEEAVHCVKFLQLQIKLLSSDDLWMYAPIAYHGIDIGLDLKINTMR